MLRASGRYQSVTGLGSASEGQFVVRGKLYDFEEVDGGSIAALVSMDFELYDRKSGKVVWSHFYSQKEPVEGKNISAVVTALDLNLDRGLTEVTAGIDQYFSSEPCQARGKAMNAEAKTVLLVDDAPANLQVVNSILKSTYKIQIATSGEKALKIANQSPTPDLILLDVMMPEMDGYEVCSHLKSAADTRDIPVIFLTGQTETDDETKGFEVGAVDYIHKPFSPAVVKARVHTHLVLRGIREQLASQLLNIQQEMETARQIQLSILPREIPSIPGLDIAARYIPMTSVAGDFYDFIQIDENRIGILVADVSGHGMPAALISSMLKIALAAQSGCASDPARVLNGLNQALYGKFQGHLRYGGIHINRC